MESKRCIHLFSVGRKFYKLNMGVSLKKVSHILLFCLVLPVFSGVASYAFNILLTNLIKTDNIPFWVETLSPLSAYAIFYTLFERRIWYWKIFRICGVTDMPDLRGRWKGKHISSYRNNGVQVEVISYLEIFQTFSKISINSYYEKSQSESVAAGFFKQNNTNYLFYVYDNEPNHLKSVHRTPNF